MYMFPICMYVQVKGFVKLKFRDMAGNVVICHRMLLSVRKVQCHCSLISCCGALTSSFFYVSLSLIYYMYFFLLQPKKIEQQTIDVSMEKRVGGEVGIGMYWCASVCASSQSSLMHRSASEMTQKCIRDNIT